MCGLMRLDLEHMALDACMPLERTRAALVELIQHKLCQTTTRGRNGQKSTTTTRR